MWRSRQDSPEETGSKYTQAGQDSAGLTAAVEDPKSVKRPNIIVIMDEVFSDLAVRGDFTTNEDYMPFLFTVYSRVRRIPEPAI